MAQAQRVTVKTASPVQSARAVQLPTAVASSTMAQAQAQRVSVKTATPQQ